VKALVSIQQVNQQDCGPAALKMLLAYVHHQSSSIFIDETWPRPMTFKQLIIAANDYGVTLKGYKLHHYSSVRGIRQPFIALCHVPKAHYVVVIPQKKFRFIIVDPKGSTQQVSVDFFQQHFSGYLLLVKHVQAPTKATPIMPAPFFKGFWLLSAGLIWSQMLLLIYLNQSWLWLLGAGGLLGGCLVWLIYIFRRMRWIDTWMVKQYLHHLRDHDQFNRFHQWKQGILLLPLHQFYRVVLLGVLWGYLSVAAPWLSMPMLVHHGLVLALGKTKPFTQFHLSKDIQQAEEKLMFPLIQDRELNQIYTRVYRLTQQYFFGQIYNLLVALIMMTLVSLVYPIQDLLTILSGITSCLVSFHYLQGLLHHRQAKQQWRQCGYHFLNQRVYAKIKA
jgi:hypothetical protein